MFVHSFFGISKLVVYCLMLFYLLVTERFHTYSAWKQEDGVASEMCGFGISGIRVSKMDLRKTGKWNWTRTVCLALVIIKLQVLLPKS